MDQFEQTQLEDKLTEFVLAGGMMYQAYGLTEEHLEALYAKAFQEYSTEQYTKALETFAYLLYLKSNEKRYLFAFGATLQAVKNYEKAIFYYGLAAEQDLSDPVITLHIVECLIALSLREEALDALEILCKETADDAQWAVLYSKAISYQSLLKPNHTTQKDK